MTALLAADPIATLETSTGAETSLGSVLARSKTTVLFYEDRDSTTLNQHVKEALFARGKSKGLLDAVTVIAIANVMKWNWFPARNFVLKAVRDIESKVHVPIYLDFTGNLTRAPWSFASDTSTVMVLSGSASAQQPVLQFKGRLSDDEVEKLFSTLEALATATP